MRRCTVLLLSAFAAILIGCGRHTSPAETDAAGGPAPVPLDMKEIGLTRNVKLWPIKELTCRPDAPHRWLDSLDYPYSDEYRRTYSYANADAVVTYRQEADTFTGTLKATGLKPNFTYQVKLVGQPTARWKDGDDATNQRLGKLGRRWRRGPYAGNAYYYYDIDPEEEKALEGYLLFDYFVTDAVGAATLNFVLDSSYHVLWRTTQWPAGSRDSTPRTYPVERPPGAAYGVGAREDSVTLYAEWEYRRPVPGQLVMPPARYQCLFLLTEESFHAWADDEGGGDWASAVAGRVDFTVVPGRVPPELPEPEEPDPYYGTFEYNP